MLSFISFPALILWFLTVILTQTSSQNECFGTYYTTVSELMKCLSKRFARSGSLTFNQFKRTLPTAAEKSAFKETVKLLLSSDKNCENITIPSAIRSEVAIKVFRNKYCVLHNTRINAATGILSRPWVVVVVPRDATDRKRFVHHSAPHFEYDKNTGNQSAAVFEKTNSISLVVTAIGRHATRVKRNKCQSHYYPADGAHTNETMFQSALLATWEWQMTEGNGCDHINCVFIQWHGKKSTSCASDDVFLSAGANNSTKIYNNNTIPAVKLKLAIRQEGEFSQLNVNTPLESNCNLVARTNVFGRVLNGLSPDSVCNNYATSVSGYFVHVEQTMQVRKPKFYEDWANALKNTFSVRF